MFSQQPYQLALLKILDNFHYFCSNLNYLKKIENLFFVHHHEEDGNPEGWQRHVNFRGHSVDYLIFYSNPRKFTEIEQI